jgi:pimeloyl-ACP methyl ester carboxylesterase
MPCSKNFANRFVLIIAIVTSLASTNALHATPRSKACSVADKSRAATMTVGERFSVQVEGEGPDIVLIPGLATPRELWEPTAAALAGCYRVHSVQVKGFGDQPLAALPTDDVPTEDVVESGAPVDASINASGPMLEPFVTELAHYIADRIVNKRRKAPAVIGHSLGGLTALMIGARHPEAVGKIMVVDALPFIGTLFDPSATTETIRPRAQMMADGTRKQYGTPAKTALTADPGANSPSGFWSNSADGRIKVANWNAASDPRVVAQALYDDMVTDMRPELGKIRAPVTLLYAQDDSVMPPGLAKAVFEPQYSGTPNFMPLMISGSRHFIMLDQPEKFAAALDAFLAKR